MSSLKFQLLENWQGNSGYWGPRRSRSNTDLSKVRIQLLNFVLKVGCPTLYHFEVEEGGLTYFPSDKLAALKSCWNLSKASLITELSGRIEEGPLGLNS